jgi:DNA replication protein DnaC
MNQNDPKPLSAPMTAVLAKLTTTPNTSRALTNWHPELDAYDLSLRAARDACAKFIASMESGSEPYWLTFTGVTGCGKTMLARQVFEESKRLNPGNPANNPIWPPDAFDRMSEGTNTYESSRPYCLWFKEGDLAARMRAGEYSLPEDLRGDYLVVMDELGIARDPTNFVSEAVGRFCDNRLGRWTIFCTNFSLNEIRDRMDARISSRLVRDDNLVVQITSGDYALRGQSSTSARSVAPSAPSGSPPPEPRKWREWLLSAYPEQSWAETAAKVGWYSCPLIWKQKIAREMTPY